MFAMESNLDRRLFCFQEFPQDLSEAFCKGLSHVDLFDVAKIDTVDDDFVGWKTKHPEAWSSEDVIDWIYSVADPLEMKLNTVCGERFQDVSGQQLCLFPVEEFLKRDKINGLQLYNCLQELLRQSQFIPPSEFIELDDCHEDMENLYRCHDIHSFDIDRMDSLGSVQPIPSFSVFLDPLGEIPLEELSVSPFQDDCSIHIPPFIDPCGVEGPTRNGTMQQDSGYESAASSFSESSTHSASCPSPTLGFPKIHPNSIQPPNVTAGQPCSHGSGSRSNQGQGSGSRSGQQKTTTCQTLTSSSNGNTDGCPQKRRPGRPPKRPLDLSSSSSSSSSSLSSSNVGFCLPAAQKKSKKSTHLWKFMLTLLDDPSYNPNAIKWENKAEGVFRIVPGQSKLIAKLWGQRKNNPSMTFDKMSRSLRWCRAYGFLSEVPKNGNYPKKLCFRFGDRAANWQV